MTPEEAAESYLTARDAWINDSDDHRNYSTMMKVWFRENWPQPFKPWWYLRRSDMDLDPVWFHVEPDSDVWSRLGQPED